MFLRSVATAALLFVASTLQVFAATHKITSSAELTAAVPGLKAGDRLVLAKGRYELEAPILVSAVGTKDAPVVIAAEFVGGVELSGPGGLRIQSGAKHVRIEGFVLTHAAGKFVVEAGASHVVIARNVFELTGPGTYLQVAGDYTEVAYNEFRNKATKDNMLSVIGPAPDKMAQGVWVHHNHFHDFKRGKENGWETIRFGLSGRSMSDANGLVEHNLFERCDGELELISNKCCAMTYRYNTFRDSKGQFTLRHGNRCLVYGNTFINTQGIRFFGDDHRIFANYLEGNSSGIQIGNGDGEVADGAKLTCHDRPDRCELSSNTLVNNAVHIALGRREKGMGATEITIANNLLIEGEATRIDGDLQRSTWLNNVGWNLTAANPLPPDFRLMDPKLARASDGRLKLTAESPLRGRARLSAERKDVDLDGQARDAEPDLGADEYSDAPVIARVLTAADVGPAAAR